MSEENSEGKSGTSGIGLTFPQIIASALAAATAAILGSFIGVLGTIGGAAVASIVSTVGSALYQRSLEATRDRVKQRLVVTGPGNTKVAAVVGRASGQSAGKALPRQQGSHAQGVAPTHVHPTRRVGAPPTPGPGIPAAGPQQARPGMPPGDPTRRAPGPTGPPTGRPGTPGRVALRAEGLADPTRVHPHVGPATGARPTAFIPQSRQPGTPPGGGPTAVFPGGPAGPAASGGPGGPGRPGGPGGPGGPNGPGGDAVTQVAALEPEPKRRRISLRGLGWKTWVTLGGVAASVFVIALVASFGVETAAGRPLSGGSSGTSVGSLFGQETQTGEATTTAPDSSSTDEQTATSTPSERDQLDQQDSDTATSEPGATTSRQSPRSSQGGLLPNLVPRDSGGSGGGSTNG